MVRLFTITEYKLNLAYTILTMRMTIIGAIFVPTKLV